MQPMNAPPDTKSNNPVLVDRAFVRLEEGLVHYRFAGREHSTGALPLYLAHAGPGSSRVFEPFLAAFGAERFAFAPDMLGNGDSAQPARDEVDIGYYVDSAIRLADALGISRFDFFGSHTGAQIGCQLAVQHPERIRKLVLDGVPLFPPEFKQQLLARYAPKVTPDDYGGHLNWAWNFVRDQQLFWPHFERTAANRLANPVSSAEQLHNSVTDVVKALHTYHIAYHAAFAQNVHELLPRLRCPVLISASERDPLSIYLDAAAELVPGCTRVLFSRTATLAERIEAVRNFLA